MNKISKTEIILFLIILALGAALISFQWGDPVDDAYVSFVYSRNLSEGQGLVFNPGERVEGYSNFLWVIILAALHGIAPIPQAAQTLGFIFGIGNIILLYFISLRVGLGKMALVPCLLLATDLRAAVWSVEGLETPLYAFLILLTIYFYVRSMPGFIWSIPALLAAMTRPEGAIVFGAVVIHRVIFLIRYRARPNRDDLIAPLIFVIGFTIYTVWRMRYFGAGIFPNTYYARGGSQGIVIGLLYFANTLWVGWGPAAAVLLGLAVVGVMTGEKTPRLDGVIYSWVAVGALVVFITGGDWMPNGRFLAPLLPTAYYCAVIGARTISTRQIGSFLLTLLVATNIVGASAYEMRDSFDKRWSRDQSSFYMPVADWLVKHDAAGAPVVLSDVGYITYYSHIRAIDTLGLTNLHLARVPGGSAWATDVNYVLGLKPTYIISMMRDYGDGKPIGHTAFDREIVKDPRFDKEYLQVAEIPGYKASERSLSDLKVRKYEVTFMIYHRIEQ